MNEHLYDMSNVVITGMNGETIGELPEDVETFCPGVSPAPPTFKPVEFEIELHTEQAKELWQKIEQERRVAINRFCQAYLDGKLSRQELYSIADALGFEIC